MNRGKDISAEHVKDKKRAKEKPVLIVSTTHCCNLRVRGTSAPTANQQSRSGAMLSSGVRSEPRNRKLPQSDAGEEAETEPPPNSQWREEPHPKNQL